MCTGRVDLSFIHRAFENGADGVFIGGCWPGECHYVTEGNYDALGNVHLYRKLMELVGLNPERLAIAWIAASEGARYAELMDGFVQQLRAAGPLGEGEGLEAVALRDLLGAVGRLLPYVKLVERERLRPPERSEEAYRAYYAGEEAGRLFDELIGRKLVTSRIVSLLGGGARSTAEIAAALGLEPSDVSRHMILSSRQGLVRYDMQRQRYALA